MPASAIAGHVWQVDAELKRDGEDWTGGGWVSVAVAGARVEEALSIAHLFSLASELGTYTCSRTRTPGISVTIIA